MKEVYVIDPEGKCRGIFGSYFAAYKFIDKRYNGSKMFFVKEGKDDR